MRDGGYELETSVIFAPNSFIPRSIRLNATVSVFGMSINLIDVQVRITGLTDVLRSVFVDKMTSEDFLRKIVEKPEELASILQSLADKVTFFLCCYIFSKFFIQIFVNLLIPS
jgi:hypothetical protein